MSEERGRTRLREDNWERWNVSEGLRRRMIAVARELRAKGTSSERVLWEMLRGGRLGGRKFRRQQPLGPFVLDFYCAAERLAIEGDGGVHADREQALLDAERQELIESLGIGFVRIADDLVLREPAKALAKIRARFRE